VTGSDTRPLIAALSPVGHCHRLSYSAQTVSIERAIVVLILVVAAVVLIDRLAAG
jgi:hypothetical protein